MVRYLRMFYVGWFGIIVVATVLQFYLAGYGVFGFNGVKDFGAHFIVGDLIGIAILLGIGLAFAARMPWRLTILSIVLLVLMFVQATLAHTGVRGLAALHAVEGVLVFVGVIYLVREAAKFVWTGSNGRSARLKWSCLV